MMMMRMMISKHDEIILVSLNKRALHPSIFQPFPGRFEACAHGSCRRPVAPTQICGHPHRDLPWTTCFEGTHVQVQWIFKHTSLAIVDTNTIYEYIWYDMICLSQLGWSQIPTPEKPEGQSSELWTTRELASFGIKQSIVSLISQCQNTWLRTHGLYLESCFERLTSNCILILLHLAYIKQAFQIQKHEEQDFNRKIQYMTWVTWEDYCSINKIECNS